MYQSTILSISLQKSQMYVVDLGFLDPLSWDNIAVQ